MNAVPLLAVATLATLPLLPALELRPPDATPGEPARAPRPLLNACGGDGGSVEYWARVLRAPDRDDRLRAARSLGEMRRADAIPALTEALNDADPAVRSEARRALEKIRR